MEGTKLLKAADIDAPALEAGAILCHVLNVSRSFLYSHDDHSLTEEEYSTYTTYIDERIKGKPLQYITGHQEFMSLDFKVTTDVLIPRHDTEVLVEAVIKYVKDRGLKKARILDIGTGSGCIAVSLAHYIEDCKVLAMDISQGALHVAKANAKKCGVDERVFFKQGNIFDGIHNVLKEYTFIEGFFSKEGTSFDVIVSNPPYIPEWEIDTLHTQVKDHEPGSSLNGGEDGLDFYRFITREAVHFLKPHSLLAYEVGYDQAKSVLGLMEENFYDLKTIKDLSGIDRVVMGTAT